MVYYVYVITNHHHTVLYTGMTNDIYQRSFDHKTKADKKSFTARFNCNKLVYYEEFGDVNKAIAREKQLKRYKRAWKEELITKMNPAWNDLSKDWFDQRELEFAKKL